MYFKPILRQLWLTRNNWTYITYITRLLPLYRTKVLFSTEDWMSPPWTIYTKPDTRTMALSLLWTQSPTCIIWVPWGHWCRYDIATIPLARNQHFTLCHETELYFILFFIFCLLLSFLHLLPFSFSSLRHRVACRRTHVSKRIYIFLCNKGPPPSLSFFICTHIKPFIAFRVLRIAWTSKGDLWLLVTALQFWCVLKSGKTNLPTVTMLPSKKFFLSCYEVSLCTFDTSYSSTVPGNYNYKKKKKRSI